jgi:hypothetical protein
MSTSRLLAPRADDDGSGVIVAVGGPVVGDCHTPGANEPVCVTRVASSLIVMAEQQLGEVIQVEASFRP